MEETQIIERKMEWDLVKTEHESALAIIKMSLVVKSLELVPSHVTRTLL